MAEEKASAAVAAIGTVKAPEEKKTTLNNRDAETFSPETYTGDRVDEKSFAKFWEEVETYLSVPTLGLALLESAAAFHGQTEIGDVTAYELAHDNPYEWHVKEVSKAPGPLLHKVCRGSEGVKLKAVLKTDGFNAWRVLAFWFQASSMALLTTMIMSPQRAEDLGDLMSMIRDYEMKFDQYDI